MKHPRRIHTLETLNNVTLDDVKRDYAARTGKRLFSNYGDIKYKEVKPVVEKLFGSWKRTNTAKMPYALRERSFTQINFIDVPNAVQSEISLVNTLDLKWLIKTFPSSYCHLY
jgi:predicted Zn-dependent peptidase